MQLNNEMPAISLHEPYATLIAAGVKVYETRDYPPPMRRIGQRIAIHAAKSKPRRSDFDQPTFDAISAALGGAGWLVLPPKLGMVVCTAVIQGAFMVGGPPDLNGVATFGEMRCHRPEDIPMAGGAPGIQTDLFGNYAGGRWCWRLTDIHVLAGGDVCRGNRGWWFWRQLAAYVTVT